MENDISSVDKPHESLTTTTTATTELSSLKADVVEEKEAASETGETNVGASVGDDNDDRLSPILPTKLVDESPVETSPVETSQEKSDEEPAVKIEVEPEAKESDPSASQPSTKEEEEEKVTTDQVSMDPAKDEVPETSENATEEKPKEEEQVPTLEIVFALPPTAGQNKLVFIARKVFSGLVYYKYLAHRFGGVRHASLYRQSTFCG